jgi:hypothetical protein
MGKPTTIVNKAARQAQLPSRAALRILSKGDPSQQSTFNFAKMTPTGATAAAMPYADIMQMGSQPEVVPALQDDE